MPLTMRGARVRRGLDSPPGVTVPLPNRFDAERPPFQWDRRATWHLHSMLHT